jgi:hypothetical protein
MKGEIIMNKLMARIVAVVLAVMMLGTVSFAAPTATKDAITTDVAERAMYTVKATKADGTFLAMYQGTTPPGLIAIDPTKVTVGETITVEYGGVDKGYATYPVVVTSRVIEESAFNAATTYTDKNGLVYENVAVATHSFIPDGVATKVGYKLTANGTYNDGEKDVTLTGANPVYINSTNVDDEETKFSGEGQFTFEVILLNVPVGVTVTALPYIEY